MWDRSALVAAVLLLSSASCLGGDGGGEASRLGMALIVPAADALEVRSLGLFALDLVEPEFVCSSYLSGEADPSSAADSIVAMEFETLEFGTDGDEVVFSGVPLGELTIIVEAYDGGGSRIFMGCQQTTVSESSSSSHLQLELTQDTTVPEP